MPVEFVAGDTGSKLIANCKNNEMKAVLDLTGATVKVKYRISGGALQTKSMSILSPATNGKAEYLFLAGELTSGYMQGEIEITDASGKVITSLDPFVLEVRAKA